MHSYDTCPVQQDILIPNSIAEIGVDFSNVLNDSTRPKILTSADAAAVVRSQWSKQGTQYEEEVKVIYLSQDNGVLGIFKAWLQGVEDYLIDPKAVFAVGFKANAKGILVTHSHPCDGLIPSQVDIVLAKHLKEVGEFFELPVLDHIVLTQDGFYSIVDEGIL